jgi:hypothetical protein
MALGAQVQWTFRLLNMAAGPAKAIRASVTGVFTAATLAQKALKGVASIGPSVFRGMRAGADAARQGLLTWAGPIDHATNLLRGMLGVIGSVGGGIKDVLSFGIEKLMFKETMVASFEMMSKSRTKGLEDFRQAVDFARVTPFETEQVVDAIQQLRGAGFSRTEAPIVFQGIGDIAAASGFNPMVMGAITTQLAQVKSLGKLTFADLKVITGWTGRAGVGIEEVYGAIAQNMGVAKSQVSGMVSGGLVPANTAIVSLLDAIKKVGGGELGGMMQRQSKTLKGLFSTLTSAAGDFFLTMDEDTDNLPGFATFKGFIENLIKLFDVGGATGKRMQGVIGKVFDGAMQGLFGIVSGPDGMKSLESISERVLVVLETVDWKGFFTSIREGMEWIRDVDWRSGLETAGTIITGLGYAWDFVRGIAIVVWDVFQGIGTWIGTGFGYVFTVIEKLTNTVLANIERIQKVWGLLGQGEFVQAGRAAYQGMQEGLFGANTGIFNLGNGMGEALQSGVKDALQIRSPSRVMMRLGAFTAEGFAQGVQSGQAGVGRSFDGMVAGAVQPQAAVTARAGGNTIHININVDARGNDGDAIASRLRELLPGVLADTLEQLALQEG